MKNVYLIGMPGCGKSTMGRHLSTKLKRNFIDLDDYIESESNKSIEEIFEDGEDAFRAIETSCLKKVSEMSNLIVATGGGIVTVPGNDGIMKSSGITVFIDADADFILKNCPLDGRPLLKNKEKIYRLYEQRIELYRSCAMYTVKNDGFFCDACDAIEKIILSVF